MAIMYLGNQMVSPVKLEGEEKAFSVDGADWLGEINAEGELVAPTKDVNVIFTGVKDLSDSILVRKFYGNKNVKSASFPDLETITGDQALLNCFSGSNINGISFPKLKTVSGFDVFESAYSSTNTENIVFPELESITGESVFNSAAFMSEKLKIANFPKLKTISDSECFYQFASYSTIEYAYFPLLETVVSDDFYQAFCGSNLIGVNFNSLISAGSSCFEECFYGTQLETVSFPNLSSVGSYCFYASFADCAELKTLYFNSLNSNSFGGKTNCFSDMLDGCSNVTVHFPVGLDATIGNWPDVLAGFGGTNTTILYDL